MFQVYFLLTVFLGLSVAQIPSFGFCPEYVPKQNFDMNRFLGKWYEAERFFQFSEIAGRCVVADYAIAPSGKIYVSNEVTNRLTGVKRIIGGNLEPSGRKNEGKLTIKYQTTPVSTTSTLTILDTDYDNYAVIWSCSGFGPVNAQSAWVMTRERLPEEAIMQEAYGVLDKFKINRTFFVKTDQAKCAVAASDLNAALGIASTSTNSDQNSERIEGQHNEKSAQPQEVGKVVMDIAEKNEVKTEDVTKCDEQLEEVTQMDEIKNLKQKET